MLTLLEIDIGLLESRRSVQLATRYADEARSPVAQRKWEAWAAAFRGRIAALSDKRNRVRRIEYCAPWEQEVKP